jgi:hypothetical protein
MNVGGPNDNAALVEFDLSSLNSGASIAHATLSVFVSEGQCGWNCERVRRQWCVVGTEVSGTNAPVPAGGCGKRSSGGGGE